MAIEREDIDRLKEIFVTRKECDSTTEEFRDKVSREDTRLAVIEHQLKGITWLLYAIGGGIVTVIVKLIFGM